jgi:hypothetical protein
MKVILAVTLLFLLIIITTLFGMADANPVVMTPPIVNANNMKTSCLISNINGEFWASVDIEYAMNTILSYGDSFLTPHLGQYDVIANSLYANYPIPLSAKNIRIQINGQEINWQYDNKGFCHIFGSNLPRINWTIKPVPKTFTIAVHYDQPIPTNNPFNSIAGQYALVQPLIPRFGSTDTPSFPLYSWSDYGATSATFTIKSGVDASLLDAYWIAIGNGSLSKVQYLTHSSKEMAFQVRGQDMPNSLKASDEQLFPYGLVITINQANLPNPSPSVPEFSWLTILTLLLTIPIAIAIIRKRVK